MNLEPFLERERLLELLADRATVGLSAEEQDQLDRLLAKHPKLIPSILTSVLLWSG